MKLFFFINPTPNHATDVLLNLARRHYASLAATGLTPLRPEPGWQIRQIHMRRIRSFLRRQIGSTKLCAAPLQGKAGKPQPASRCVTALLTGCLITDQTRQYAPLRGRAL